MKYEFVKDDTIMYGGTKLTRIRALRRTRLASRALGEFLKKGELGGYIQKESNLSQEGKCWVFPGSFVIGDAQVLGNVCVREGSIIRGYVKISGNIEVQDTTIAGDMEINGDAVLRSVRLQDEYDWPHRATTIKPIAEKPLESRP
jgi:bifunctional N-acetylglucosamine-1-phosphate-uridyltransferase/glucosamine-1-phosphate-acetyltransferase GlmU-like protein